VPIACEHGAECHDGTSPSTASAPEAARAWLLIEHPGPWPAEVTDAEMPGRLRTAITAAEALGIRVQFIRRPGRRTAWSPDSPRMVIACWTAGDAPWLRRGMVTVTAGLELGTELGLDALAAGRQPTFGGPATDPVYLVCVNGRRDVCCARFGVPLAQALAARHPGHVWETTHVGGHRFAPNLVLLPHGLYYGPVGTEEATAAIDAYTRGAIVPDRYRGRAGQPREDQVAEHRRLTEAGSLAVTAPR
jgi:hypothetical protein